MKIASRTCSQVRRARIFRANCQAQSIKTVNSEAKLFALYLMKILSFMIMRNTQLDDNKLMVAVFQGV